MLPRNEFCCRAPKCLSRTWTCPSTCSADARPGACVRGTLWNSELCIFKYVCQRDCTRVCICILAHPYKYQKYLKSPMQILKEPYKNTTQADHPHSPHFEEICTSQATKIYPNPAPPPNREGGEGEGRAGNNFCRAPPVFQDPKDCVYL